MPVSYPSKILTILDVPEVFRFSARFTYNFFVPDEKVNDSGDSRLHGTTTSEQTDSLRKRIPRWVEFSFDPADVRTNISAGNEFAVDISKPKVIEKLLGNNLDKIQREVDVASKGYSSLNLQDRNVQYKTSKLLKLSVRTRGRSMGYHKDWYTKGRNQFKYTRANYAKLLNEMTGDYIAGNWITRAMGTLLNRGVYVYRTRSGRRIGHGGDYWLRRFADVNQYIQVNDKFVADIMSKSMSDPTSPFMHEMSYQLKDAQTTQENARKSDKPGSISDYEYKPNFDPVSIDRVDPGEFNSAVKIVGYIIDKWEVMPNRRIRRHKPIVVAGSANGKAVDTRIKYGAYYRYSIRAIALCQFQAIDEETAQVYAISGLISSRSSTKKQVLCREYRPPQPPGDLDFVWDYANKKLNIMWSFPVVPQRDVKRFQVFKRMSINEPFELQVEYDFDDSEVPDPRSEMPRKSKVVQMSNPLTIYCDEEFTKGSFAIYSLCSIDAHDFSSNYSAQFLVWFDETKNRLVKKLISPSGAPKPYPNFYLVEGADSVNGEISLTSDCIKDSGHSSCRIFFDPEYLSIKGDNNDELDLWTTKDEGGSYKLQIINTDRQKSQVVDIEIEDLRTGK